jgi:hypothetical protein
MLCLAGRFKRVRAEDGEEILKISTILEGYEVKVPALPV